jgi:hypothetical protein
MLVFSAAKIIKRSKNDPKSIKTMGYSPCFWPKMTKNDVYSEAKII